MLSLIKTQRQKTRPKEQVKFMPLLNRSIQRNYFYIRGRISTIRRPQRILVIHIMKTAGTSLRHMLENEYGAHQVYPGDFYLSKLPNGWYPLGREVLKNYNKLPPHKVLVGHFTAAMNDMLPRSYRTAIFLREPVQRSLSMLAHFSRTNGVSVPKLLEDPHFMSTHIEDYQTRILGASGVCDPGEVELINNEVFNQAQERLKNITFVGITEEFGKSCQVFDRMFKTKISKCIKKDRVLYKSAQERFKRDLDICCSAT